MSCRKGECLPGLRRAQWVDGWILRRSSVARRGCVGELMRNSDVRGARYDYVYLASPSIDALELKPLKMRIMRKNNGTD